MTAATFTAIQVQVRNLGGEPVGHTYLDRAIALVNRGDAKIVEADESRIVRSAAGKILKFPRVIELLRYIYVPFIISEEFFSPKGVLRRDNFTCGYCGTKKGTMTWDHIIPKSRGGQDTWENSISACQKCNSEKGNMFIEEWNIWRAAHKLGPRALLWEPFTPTKTYFKSGKKPREKKRKMR